MWWTFAWLTSSSGKLTYKTWSVSKWRCPLFASLFWLEMSMTQTRMNANCEVPASCECDNLRIQLSWIDLHRSSQITSLEDLGRIRILSITDHTYPHTIREYLWFQWCAAIGWMHPQCKLKRPKILHEQWVKTLGIYVYCTGDHATL